MGSDQATADLFARVQEWIDDDPDPRTATELSALLAAARDGAPGRSEEAFADLADRFSGFLQFGTAGLRGALGGGPARMNRAVVARAAAGLGAFLTKALSGKRPKVVIGFDARYGSDAFAQDSAQILAGAGVEVTLFDQHCPTPVLAYAVLALEADAGVMVTASHNPPQDNGYKVYLGGPVVGEEGRGAQIVDPYDRLIAEEIARITAVSALPRSREFHTAGDELIAAYIDAVLALAPAGNPQRDLRIAYTPMHGVGGEVFTRVLTRAGFTHITEVSAQLAPDPDFPTVAFPNPEEEGALDLAFEAATAADADLIIANDPDADRVSAAIPSPGGWRQLSGDEIGALLGEMIARRGARGAVFANSVVSSRLLAQIARHHGIPHHQTLTGFKWIARTPGLTYGYEEAIGYAVAPQIVRDKDGISAGLMIALLAAEAAAEGRTLADLLDELTLRHGLYATGALSARFEDLSLIPAAMARLRSAPPTHLAGSPVTSALDLSTPTGDLPATDALIYTTAASDQVIVRPSGTEPKVKCYLEVIVDVAGRPDLPRAHQEAQERLEALKVAIAAAAGLPDQR